MSIKTLTPPPSLEEFLKKGTPKPTVGDITYRSYIDQICDSYHWLDRVDLRIPRGIKFGMKFHRTGYILQLREYLERYVASKGVSLDSKIGVRAKGDKDPMLIDLLSEEATEHLKLIPLLNGLSEEKQ